MDCPTGLNTWHTRGCVEGYSTSNLTWRETNVEKFRTAVMKFHDRYAQQPQTLHEAKLEHEEIIDSIQKYISSKFDVCKSKPSNTGSSYEGVKVKKDDENDDLEFDTVFVINEERKFTDVKVFPGRPDYALLQPIHKLFNWPDQQRTFVEDCCKSHNTWSLDYLDPGEMVNKFYGLLQKKINDLNLYSVKLYIRLRRHGPAVEMDVYKKPKDLSKPPYYSVDVVPAIIMVDGRTSYIANPPKVTNRTDSFEWRKFHEEQAGVVSLSSVLNWLISTVIADPVSDYIHMTYTLDMSEIEKALQKSYNFHYDYDDTEFGMNGENCIKSKALVLTTDSHKNKLKVTPQSDDSSYVWLDWLDSTELPTGELKPLKLMVRPDCKHKSVNSKDMTNLLANEIKSCISRSSRLQGRVTIRRNGPEIRLYAYSTVEDMSMDSSLPRNEPVYSVDVILAIVVGSDLYIARPEKIDKDEFQGAWRKSVSVEETEELKKVPEKLKMVLRILKALRIKQFPQLTTYSLKTIVLSMFKNPHVHWTEETIEEYVSNRFLDALDMLKGALEKKDLRSFFQPEINLFGKNAMSHASIGTVFNRLSKLLDAGKTAMLTALHVRDTEEITNACRVCFEREEMSKYRPSTLESFVVKSVLDFGGKYNVLKLFMLLQILCNRLPELACLTPYHLETAIKWVMDEKEDWSEQMLGERLWDVLDKLENCAEERYLPDYSNPQKNLFSQISTSSVQAVQEIINHLRQDEKMLIQTLLPPQK